MDTSKIIRGVVSSGRYTVTAPIVKEDYGLYLKIEGVELPSTYEVDFSNSENSGTSVTMIGNSDGVLIPHQFIDSGKDVFAFLYHVGADFGRTVYKFRIPNKVRPDRTDEQPTPEEQSTIDQAINALNTAVAQTAQDKADADVSAQNASADAERAEEARTDAQNYATQAEQSATDAHESASQASAYATASAQSASQSAQIKADVEDLADDAQGYAQASAQSASASANSASQAQGYAQSASASAQSASQSASGASASAQTASAKAQDASTSAQTASAKASEASQSASQALAYKTDAESAKTASQTAQGLAESARDTAVQAKTDAESARDAVQASASQIAQNTTDIADLEEDLRSVIDDITQPVVGLNIFDNDFDESGYYNHGAEASGSNFTRTSKFYEIADGVTTLYAYHTVDASTCNYVFYDADKAWLANRNFNSAQTSTVIPTGAKYFRVYKHISLTDPITIAYVSVDYYIPFEESYDLKDGSVSYDKLDAELQEKIDSGDSDLAETVAEHTSTLNQITRATTSPNIFDGNFDEIGNINSSGKNESNSSYKRTSAYYEIGENSGSLYVILTATTTQFRLRFYGADNSYKGTGACNNLLTTVISIPTDATKFRVYTFSDFNGNSCISVTPQSEYVPYGSGKALAEDLVDYEALDDDLKEKVGGWLKGKTIAFMGDSIVGNFYDATGICALLAEKTGATVHNCAFGGTQMALRNSEVQNVQYWNALSGYSMSDAIASGDFSAQQTAVDNITGGIAYFKSRLAYIKTIDWSAVDIIMWEYGTNDFSNGNIPIKDTSDLTNVYSYYGAYCHAIETILTAYPHIRIVPVTPLWRYWQDSQDDHAYLYGSDEHEIGGQLLPNFAKCVIEIANIYHLPVIDDYFGLDANKWTRGQYFDVTDSVHPNANGRARIASRLAHILPTLL